MSKPTIFISAVSGDIGCAAVISLRERAGRIIGCDIKSYSPVANILDIFYNAPPAYEIESYIAFLKRIIEKEKVEYFLPISESEIEVLNLRRDEIKKTGVKLLLNNKKIIEICLDKLKTMEYLKDLNIKVPETVLLDKYKGNFSYPLIVKARKSCGSKKIWIIENDIDLEYIRYKNDGSFIVQEYIGSETEDYTTGIFSDGKKVSSISFKRKLGYGGLSAEAILVDEPFLDNLAYKIAKNMNLIGSINLQTRRVGAEFIPYEINPRLSSTLLFRKHFGFDDAVWWIDVLEGKGYSYEKKYKSGRAIRYLTEYYFDLIEMDKQ